MTKMAPKPKKAGTKKAATESPAGIEAQVALLKKEHPKYTGALNEATDRDARSNTGYLRKTVHRILNELENG